MSAAIRLFAALVSVLALLALASPSVRAEDAALPPLPEMMVVEAPFVEAHDQAFGLYAAPSFAASGAFLALDLALASEPLDRGVAAAEIAVGLAGSAWTGFLLSDAVRVEVADALPLSTFTTGAALALNLRMTVSATMRWLLVDADEALLAAVPSLTIVPREGGVTASLRWAI